MLYNNNEKVILELKEKFIESNLPEKYLLLNELTNNIATKDSIPFYNPSFNRYSVILNNLLDDVDSGKIIDEEKILRLITQYFEILYRDPNKHKKYQIILVGNIEDFENAGYSCAMKSHFRKFGNQMSGSGNHLCKFTLALIYPSHKPHA